MRWGGPAHPTYISTHLRSNTGQSQCTICPHRHSAKKYCTTTLQRHMALNRRQTQPMSFELQIHRKRNGQRATKRNLNCPLAYLSSPKPGHTAGGSGRHGAGRKAGRGDAGQKKVPTFRSPWKPTAPLARQRTVNNCSERLFASTNRGNPM